MPDQLDIVIDSSGANQSIDSLERSLNEAVVKTDRLSEKLKKLKTDAPQKIYVDVEYREKGKPVSASTDKDSPTWSKFAKQSAAQRPLPSPESKAVSDSLKSINRELSQQSIALRAIQNAVVAERAVGRSRSGSETEDKVRSGKAGGKEDITQISPERWLNRIASHTMQMVPIQRDISRKLSEIKVLLRAQGGGGAGGAIVPPVATGGAGTVGWFAEKGLPPTSKIDEKSRRRNREDTARNNEAHARLRDQLMQNLRRAQGESNPKSVFISGSRSIKALDNQMRKSLDNIIARNMKVLVGDAPGVDKLVQQHLAKAGYGNVEVFASNGSARNNLGNWSVRGIQSSEKPGSRQFYTAKDIAMSKAADYGLAFWDGKSKGTLANIERLQGLSVPTKIHQPTPPPVASSTIDPKTGFETKYMSPAQSKLFKDTGIGVFNIHNEGTGRTGAPWEVYTGRSGKGQPPSILGNYAGAGFDSRTPEGRAASIEAFRQDLWRRIKAGDKDTMKELNRLADIRNKYGKLALMDFCAPKDCHAEVIARAVDYVDRQRKQAEGQIKRKVSESAKATERAVKQQYMSPDETKLFKPESTESYRKRQVEQNTRKRNLLENQGVATWAGTSQVPITTQGDTKIQLLSYTDKDMDQFRGLARTYAKNIVGDLSQKDISDRIFGYFTDQAYQEMQRKMDPDGKGVGKEAQKKLQRKAGAEAFFRLKDMSETEQRNLLTRLFEEKGFEKIKREFQEQQRNTPPQRPPIVANDRGTDFFLNSDLEQSNRYFDMDDRTNPARNIDKAWKDRHIDAARWKELMENRKRRGQSTDWGVMSDELADKIYRKNMIIRDHASSGADVGETVSRYWESEQDYFMKQQAQYGTGRLLRKQIDSMTAEGLGGAEPSQMHYQPWTKEWYDKQTGYKKALNQYLKEHGPLPDAGNQEWARIQAEELRKQEETDSAARRLAQKNEANERRRQESTQRHTEDLARKYPAQTAQEYEDRRRLAYANRGQQIVGQRTPFDGPDQQYMTPRQRRAARQEALARNRQFESWFMPAGTEPSGHIQTHGDLNKRFAAAERRKQTELDNIQLREIERRPDGINKIQEAARKRQGQINTVIENEQLRQIERRPEGIDRVGEMMRKRQEFFNLIDTVDKVEIGRQEKKARVFNQAIDSMRDGSKTLPPPITRRFETESSQSTATGKKPSYEWKRPGQIVRAEDILSSIQLDERDRMTSEHGKLFARQFDSKALIDANKDAVRSSENLLAAEQHLAKSKKELNDYRKDGLALIEREIKKQNEAGKMMLPHEQERFRKQQVQNLEDSMRKEIQKNKELEDSRNRLTSAYQNDAEKMKRAIAERHRSLKTLEKIEAEYRKKADTGKLTKAEEDLYRDTIKPRMAQERQDLNYYKNQLSEHRRYQDMIQKTGMSLRDLKTIEENYGKTLKKTTQGYREAGEVLRKQGILGYGSEKRVHNLPRLQTGGVIGTGRGGGGGGWDSDRLTQIPQNPLMGRMAQFGMMASGMAATVFLTQMIGAQIANLINIIKAFEDSIESITESVKMTDNEINALPKVIRQYSNQMGIGTAMFAAATEVALKAGLSGKKEDIASLYGLQRSQNINNYGQATLLTRLAGSSSFFADIRKEYMQQWYRYSGRTSEGAFQIDPQTGKKQLGTFGYEWERLLGAGKESVLEIFFKENTKYGERLKRTMADITEWINTNQETFGRWADNVGTGINVVRSGFSLLGKELLMVLGLWASWQVGALAASGIKILSTNIVKVTNILKTFKDAIVATAAASMGLDMGMAGVAKTGMSLGAIFTGMISALKSFLVPALAFFAAFKTGLYLWDKWQESKRKSSIMESNRAFDPAGMTFAEASKQLPSINKEIEIRKKAISEAENKIRNINKTRDQGTDLWGTGLLQTSMAESRAEKKLTSEIEQNKEYLEILKAQKQEIMEIEEIEAFGRSFKGIYEMKEILSVLQQTNQELGFMPAELAIYERGAIEEQYKKWQELLGTGTARALTSIAMLDLSMKEDPDKKALYDISQAMDEIGVIGYNQYDRQAFKIKTIKNERENQLRNLSQLIETDPNIIKEITSIEQEIDQLSKLIVNFQKLSAIENVINFKKALYDLQITIQDMDKSPLEKIFSEIDRRDIEGSNKEILKMNEALKAYSQLQKDFLKSAGMNPENADKLRDLNAMYERTGREKDSAYYFNQVQIEYDRQKERIDLLKNIPTSFSGTSKWYDSLYLEEKLNETSLKLQQSKTIFNKRGDDKKITEMFEAASKKYGMNISTWDQYIQAQIDMTIASAEARNKIKEINLAWEDQIGLIEKFNLINPKYISDLEEIGKLKIKEEYPYLNEDDIEKKYKSQDLLKQLTDIQRDIEDVRIFDGWASAIALQEEIAKQEIKRIANEITKIKKFQEVSTEDIEQRLLSALNLQTNEFDLAQKFSEITQAVAASSGELTESAINNEYALIKNSYEARKALANEFKDEEIRRAILISAENIKQEEMYQAKLSMRKHIDDDIQVGFEEGFRAIRDQSKTTGEMIGISISTGFDHASNAMGDFITGTKSASEAFRNMASSIISDLTRMMIKQQMMNLLIGESYSSKKTNKVGGIIGTISGLFGSSSGFSGFTRQITPAGVPLGFAKGGVFSNISDQSNTIINKTTPFEYSGLIKFASGAGVMGEAGPEAVMPLIRMPSGNLGVEAKSSLPKIKINIINKGNSDVASATQEDLPQWNGEEWVIGVVLEHVANNKKNFRTSMKGMLNA